MKLFILIGICLGFIGLTSIAATPNNPFITMNPIEITVLPKTELIYTPSNITPKPLPNQFSKYPEIQSFLNNLSDCDWCIACGSYASYTRNEAKKQNINIGEITIIDPNKDRVKSTLISGHRINYFYADDGHRVYIDNIYNWGIILEGYELKDHIKNKFGFDLKRIGFKDSKI